MSFSKDTSPVENDRLENDRPEGKKLSTDMIAGTAERDPVSDRVDHQKTAETQRTVAKQQHLEPLFENNADGEFRSRWREIQAGFVDEPRNAVERADELVAELMQKLAQSFSKQRNDLEHQWDASENVSTEDLRVALTRYRSFFERLLSV